MRLAQKAATVLALADMVRSPETRERLVRQVDAALALMIERAPLATAALDSACHEALLVLKREGWTTGRIAQRVMLDLRAAKVAPTVKGRGDA